jgi:outer membrane immunogenic protein
MKKYIVAGIALFALSSVPAFAADMLVKAPVYKAPIVAPAFSWTGCYIGANAGGLWGRTRWSGPPQAGFEINQTVGFSSATAGGQLGCNYQINRLVWGVEGDLNWTHVDKFGIQDPTNLDEILRTKFDWFGSIRGRLGYAQDRWLVYGTGGIAFTKIRNAYENYTDATRTVVQGIETNTNKTGWVAGLGFEYAVHPNWIVGIEYLHYGFGRKEVEVPGIEFARTSFDVVRARLSYKFGDVGKGPVSARY